MGAFCKDFFLYGAIIFVKELVIRLAQPLLLWSLIICYTNDQKHTKKAYFCISLMIISIFLNVICYHWHVFTLSNLGMKIKIACSSLIYRKSLKLNKNSMNKTTAGQIVNLLSNDLTRFDKCLLQLHYFLVAPVQLVIVSYVIYTMMHPTGVVGIGVYLVAIPIYLFLGKKFSEYRLKTATKSDERIRLIDEIIYGIETIKMYTWEALFIEHADTARKQEIHYIRKSSFLRAFQSSFNKYLARGAIFLCILLYVLSGNQVRPEYNFVIKGFYLILKDSMTMNLPEAIKNVAETRISIKRVQGFLLCDEVPSNSVQEKCNNNKSVGIRLEGVSVKRSSLETLTEINFFSTPKQLVAIIGLVGSGKTSLIKVLLKEVQASRGTVDISGKISYCSQEPWLFAASVRENILFGQIFNEQKYMEVIRVCALEQDFKHLRYGDLTLVGDRGITLSGGQKARISLARAVYRDADIYLLDDPLSAVDTSVGKQLFEECILNYLSNKCVIFITHQIQYLEKCDNIYLLKGGRVAAVGDLDLIRSQDEDLARHLKENFDNEEIDALEDEIEDKKSCDKNQQTEMKTKEKKNNGKIPWRVYRKYIFSGGGCAVFCIAVLFLLSQGMLSGADYFEAYWIRMEETVFSEGISTSRIFTPENCIYIYVGFMVAVLLCTTFCSISFFAYFMKVSIKLHDRMFSSVIKATVSFFYNNQSGSILNRFSKDIGSVDTNLPKLFLDTVERALDALSVIIIISLINPWMVITSTVMLALFYYLRVIYLSTSREVKRIEATTRSDVFSHMNESLQGLSTIRAFEVERNVKKQFDSYLNRNTGAYYTLLSCSTTFGLWLDLLCAGYIAVVTSFCFFTFGTRGEDLGLLITQAMALSTTMQWGMRQWSEFENEMTSVERIIEYTDIDPDVHEANTNPPPWPDSCDLEFQSVVLRYKSKSPPALNDLSIKINPREKVGIVGRTGAGKSSIISALFRLVKFEGSIFIDGININNLPLQMVRSKISIILQEPVLFSGTLRENLDPFQEFCDTELWQILEELELKSFVANLPMALQSRIYEKGSNLSVGQRQLICLARALLRKNKILVLDEATASIDFKTDALIQSTIKRKFVDCTVLIIAHRLNTIIDCDKVLVMDAGRAVEFDRPFKLLAKENGILHELVMKTGKNMSDNLKQIAKENYDLHELSMTKIEE